MSSTDELVAKVLHNAWMGWSKDLFNEWGHDLPLPLVKRWTRNWVAYEDLPEHEKEKDRRWAKEIRGLLTKSNI